MLIVPTIASVLSGPSMWAVSEILFLFNGLIVLFAFVVIKNEIAAIIGCAIVWVAIFLLPIKLDKKPKIRIMVFIFQGIFSTLNAIIGMMIIAGKYV